MLIWSFCLATYLSGLEIYSCLLTNKHPLYFLVNSTKAINCGNSYTTSKKIPKINLEHKLSQCLPFIFVQVQHFFLGYSDLENRGKHDNYYYSPWLKTYIVLVFF